MLPCLRLSVTEQATRKGDSNDLTDRRSRGRGPVRQRRRRSTYRPVQLPGRVPSCTRRRRQGAVRLVEDRRLSPDVGTADCQARWEGFTGVQGESEENLHREEGGTARSQA